MHSHSGDTATVRSKPWSFTRLGLSNVALWALFFCLNILLYPHLTYDFWAVYRLRMLILAAAVVTLAVFITMATLNKCWSALNIICACVGCVSFIGFVLWLMFVG